MIIAFIGWYNPGNVIIKKLETVNQQTAAVEAGQTFTTPPTQDEMVKQVAFEVAAEPEKAPKATTAKKCTEAKDPYKKLEQIIELTTDARLAALTKRLEELPEEMAFVNNIEVVDYSMPAANVAIIQSPLPQQDYPYVPGSSFYFQAVEDTTLPKKYVMAQNDLKAKQAMEKSMQALQQVNWKKLEATLKAQGMKVNIDQIQKEIETALGANRLEETGRRNKQRPGRSQ